MTDKYTEKKDLSPDDLAVSIKQAKIARRTKCLYLWVNYGLLNCVLMIILVLLPSSVTGKLFSIIGAVINLLFAFYQVIKYKIWCGQDSYTPYRIKCCKYNYRVFGSFWTMELL